MLIMANHSGERSERQCVFIGSAVLGSAKVQVEPFPGLNTGSFQGKAIGSSPSLDTHAQLDNIAVSSCNVATQNKLISSLSQTPAVESTIPMKYSQEFQPEIASLPVISSENIFKQMPPLTNYAETTQMFRNCSVNISNEEKDKSDSIIEDNIFVDIATVDIHTSFDRDVPLDQSYNVGTEYVSNSETSTYVDNDLAGKLNEEGSRRDQSQIIIEPLTDAALSEPGHIDKQHGLISYSKDVERASNRNSALLPKPETGNVVDIIALETRKQVVTQYRWGGDGSGWGRTIEMTFVHMSMYLCIHLSQILYPQLLPDASSDFLETLKVFLLWYEDVHVVWDF